MKASTVMIGAFVLSLGWMAYKLLASSYKNSLIERVKARLAIINPDYAELDISAGDSSATVDKSEISLCVSDPKTGRDYSVNTLMYVALHEVAHVVTPPNNEDAHGPAFTENFSRLLKIAARKGVYDPTSRIPKDYCGV
jgi:hypothetical protein